MILFMDCKTEFVEDRFEGGVAVSEQLLVKESVVVVVAGKDHTL